MIFKAIKFTVTSKDGYWKNKESSLKVNSIYICLNYKSVLEWFQIYLFHVKLFLLLAVFWRFHCSVNFIWPPLYRENLQIWSNCSYHNSNILHVVKLLEFKDKLVLKSCILMFILIKIMPWICIIIKFTNNAFI